MVKVSVKILLPLLVVLYPALIYFGLRFLDGRTLGLSVLAVVAIFFLIVAPLQFVRSSQVEGSDHANVLPPNVLIAGVVATILSLLTIFLDDGDVLLYYPVFINLSFLFLFGQTLYNPPTLIERLAARGGVTLTPQNRRYMRHVTMAWCVFFVFNGAIAFYSAAFASREFWAVYNGLVSYVLIGVMFACEFVIRQFVKRKHSAPADV